MLNTLAKSLALVVIESIKELISPVLPTMRSANAENLTAEALNADWVTPSREAASSPSFTMALLELP